MDAARDALLAQQATNARNANHSFTLIPMCVHPAWEILRAERDYAHHAIQLTNAMHASTDLS